MDQFKFPSMRESFEEQYKAVRVPAKNKKGFRIEYVYIGPWYVWMADPVQVKKIKIRVLNACMISLVLYIAAATRDDPVNYERMISLTGLLSLAPFVFELFGIIQFWVSKEKMTEPAFRDISGKLKIAPVLHAGLLILCCLIGMRTVIQDGYEITRLLILLCYGLSALESLSVFLIFQRLAYKKADG